MDFSGNWLDVTKKGNKKDEFTNVDHKCLENPLPSDVAKPTTTSLMT